MHPSRSSARGKHGQVRMNGHPRRNGSHEFMTQLSQLLALIVKHVHLPSTRFNTSKAMSKSPKTAQFRCEWATNQRPGLQFGE
jgi:hypothetical protein